MHIDTRHPSEWILQMTHEAVEEAPDYVDPNGALPPTHALISVIPDLRTNEPQEVRILGHAAVLCWLSDEYALVVSRYRNEMVAIRSHVHRRHLWPLPGSSAPQHVSEVAGLDLTDAMRALVEPLHELASAH